MNKKFEIFQGLSECMKACNLDEDKESDCVYAIGMTFIDNPRTVLDAFINANIIESRGAYKRAPQKMWINSIPVNPHDVWKFGVSAVLTYTKKRNIGTVVWIRKVFENEDGTVYSP